MSHPTNQRVKAFLDRQKDKSTTPKTRDDPHLITEYDNYKQTSTTKSYSQDKDFDLLNDSMNSSQNNTINCGYNTPLDLALNDRSSEQDYDKILNYDDTPIRITHKPAPSGYRVEYEKKKALLSGESRLKTEPSAKVLPQTFSSQKRENSTNKTAAEPGTKRANLRIQPDDSEPAENIRQKTKSPLDKFFDQKLTTKIKIKKHLNSYSRENPSYTSTISRAKTPQHTQEEPKDRSPRDNKTPKAKSRSPKPLRIQVNEEIITPQLSPLNNKKIMSPMQSSKKKTQGFRDNSEKKVAKQPSNLNEEPEKLNHDSKEIGVKSKVAAELASLDKLLKNERRRNKDGFFGGYETLSAKADENGLKDSSIKDTSRRETTPSKFSESASRDEIKSRSQTPRKDTQTPRKDTQRSTTPKKQSKSPSSPSKRSTGHSKRIFEDATKTLEKFEKSETSPQRSNEARGRHLGQVSNDSGHEEMLQHAEFKKEVKKMLKNIHEEKEQLVKNLAEMNNKLSHYESAYNNLKIEFESYKSRDQKKRTFDQSASREDQGNSSYLGEKEEEGEEDQYRKVAKNHKVDKCNEFSDVFSIDHLNLSPNRASSKTRETRDNPRDDSLLGHVQAMNEHVEELISKSPIKTHQTKPSWSTMEQDTIKPFEFFKYPEAVWVTKDMSLNIRVFNSDAIKDGALKLGETEPKNKDQLLKAQRKLLHEENQRLATEEQAHIMISTIESSLSPMRGRRKYPEIKKAESTTTPGTDDTSKSIIHEKQL